MVRVQQKALTERRTTREVLNKAILAGPEHPQTGNRKVKLYRIRSGTVPIRLYQSLAVYRLDGDSCRSGKTGLAEMIIPDLNILLHAADSRSARHETARNWLDQLRSHPLVRPVELGKGHAGLLRHLSTGLGTAANQITDAHLAALALENDSNLASGDRNFLRFPGLHTFFYSEPAFSKRVMSRAAGCRPVIL